MKLATNYPMERVSPVKMENTVKMASVPNVLQVRTHTVAVPSVSHAKLESFLWKDRDIVLHALIIKSQPQVLARASSAALARLLTMITPHVLVVHILTNVRD